MVNMTTLDLDALQAAAEAATPGPWFSYCPDGAALNPERATFLTGPKYRIMDKSLGFSPQDGDYMAAARPEVMLALIDRLRKAEDDLKFVRDDLASTTRMFHAACAGLGAINEALGLDPNDGGAEPILDAIGELKRERDEWVDAQFSAAPTSADSEGAKG